jgi:hypothetical protein
MYQRRFASQIGNGAEDAARDDFTFDPGEPQLDFI